MDSFLFLFMNEDRILYCNVEVHQHNVLPLFGHYAEIFINVTESTKIFLFSIYGNQDYCPFEICGHKFEVSLVSKVVSFFTSRAQLHRPRYDIWRQLDFIRLGVSSVEYNKGQRSKEHEIARKVTVKSRPAGPGCGGLRRMMNS